MISIIVSAYNCANTISKTINSILDQSFNDFELLFIDDKSTDNTLEIIRSFNDSRIKIYSKKHSGVSASRNYGIKLAEYNYLCFVDGDDYLDKDYLSDLYTFMIDNDCDFVMCNYNKVIGNNIYKVPPVFNKDTVIENKNILINKLFYGNNKYNLYSNCMGLYKKDIIINNNLLINENIDYGEDILFNYQYIHHIERFGYINKALYYYVYNENSLSNNITLDKLDILFKTIKDNLNEYEDSENRYIKSYYLNQYIVYLTNRIFKLDKEERVEQYKNINNYLINDISYADLFNFKDRVWLYLFKKRKYEDAYMLWKIGNIFNILK